jgi:hypothetical protein
MRSEYDFSQSRRNPYANRLKRQVTIRLDTTAVDYFKELAGELGMPYQNLINLFLRDCAMRKRRPVIQWPRDSTKRASRPLTLPTLIPRRNTCESNSRLTSPSYSN